MTFISALKIETVEAKLSYVTTKPYLQIKLFGISEEHLYCSGPLSEGKQTVNVFPSTYYFFYCEASNYIVWFILTSVPLFFQSFQFQLSEA